MAWHRHALAPVSLYEPQQPYPAVHGPFAYCPICECVPTAIVGPFSKTEMNDMARELVFGSFPFLEDVI